MEFIFGIATGAVLMLFIVSGMGAIKIPAPQTNEFKCPETGCGLEVTSTDAETLLFFVEGHTSYHRMKNRLTKAKE